MNKEQKKDVVAQLTEELKGAEAVFAIDYRGISVPQAAELRSGLREAGTRFRVVKNRLTLLAAEEAGTEELKDHLTGPTALALVDGDVALAAKTISRLGGEWQLLDYKGGIMNGEALEPDSFKTIARLPGRDQLNAQFAGIVASPLTGLVRGLGSMIRGLASQLQQMADQGLVSGEGKSEPDPDPKESSEEDSEEDLPEEASEESTEVVEQTGEGDAEPGEAAEGGEEEATQDTSEETQDTSEDTDSEEKKEEGD